MLPEAQDDIGRTVVPVYMNAARMNVNDLSDLIRTSPCRSWPAGGKGGGTPGGPQRHVQKVAEAVGYDSTCSFAGLFRKKVGVSRANTARP